jgi:hypothetical protein
VKNVVQILVLHMVVLVILKNIYDQKNTNYPTMMLLQVHQCTHFSKKTDSPSSKDFEVAAVEDTWAYHTVQESHSFRSNDCAQD